MDESSYSELSIIEETKNLLLNHGESEVVYITAEFSPFSNQQKPDLQFIKKFFDDTVFFIEYKILPSLELNQNYLKSIIEHKEFVQEGTDLRVRYGFSTNINVSEEYQKEFKNNGIQILPLVKNPKQLFNSIIEWSSALEY